MITATDITLHRAENVLKIIFSDTTTASTTTASLPAEYLRIESPSAEVQGHTPAGRKLEPGKRHVAITAIEPVGNYAIRLTFSDGHNTGIYSWDYLHRLAQEHGERWHAYVARLQAAGLNRDR